MKSSTALTIGTLAGLLFISYKWWEGVRETRVAQAREQAILDFFGQVQDEREVERQTRIALDPNIHQNPRFTPVHLVGRREGGGWKLLGMGTIVKDLPNKLITTYNALAVKEMEQFGYRRIGKDEFFGNAVVYPITEIPDPGETDNVITCTTNELSPDFRTIRLKQKRGYLPPEAKPDETWVVTGTVQLLTDPRHPKSIAAIIKKDAGDETAALIDYRAYPLEGGTGGLVQSEKEVADSEPDILVVIIGQSQLSPGFAEKMKVTYDPKKIYTIAAAMTISKQ